MIRNASEQDKLALGKIYCYSWKAAYSGIIPKHYLDSLTLENCAPKSINPDANIIVETGNEVVGLINYGKGRDENIENMGEIRAIYVLPEYWQKDIGKDLFLYALHKMNEMCYDGFYLWVLKDNHRARKFYKKMLMVCTNIEKTIIISDKELIEVKYEYRFVE